MKVKVHMLAFGKPDEVRFVEVNVLFKDMDHFLDQVFHFGQNDFQPQEHPSVSVGDVIEFQGIRTRYFLVKPVGFRELTKLQLAEYRAVPRMDRVLSSYLEEE